MKRATSLIIVVSLAVLLSGCSLLQGQKAATSESADGQGIGQSQGPFAGSLQAAVKLGVPMKCTYKVADTEVEGWIKGKKYRGKIKNQQGQTAEVVMKDDCMWTWSEGENQGVKMCFDFEEGKDMWDPDAWKMEGEEYQDVTPPDVEYRCAPTVVSDAKFNPPSDVQFMDLDQMMQGFGEETAPSDEEMNEMMEKMNQMMGGEGGE